MVALFAGVFAGGFSEFGGECIFNIAETGVIGGAQEHGEIVGNNAATLDIDRAIVVHFTHETAPEFDGTDGAATPTREHTIDHTLQSPLY